MGALGVLLSTPRERPVQPSKWPPPRPRAPRAAAGGLALLLLGVAASRVVLMADRPTEAATGLLLGVALSASFALAVGTVPRARLAPGGLGLAAGVAALLVAGAQLAGDGGAAVAGAPAATSIAMTEGAWRKGGWRAVERGLIGFDGEVERPFLLQWAGDPAPLERAVVASGWAPAPPWTLAALPLALRPSTPLDRLPPGLETHLGRAPVAVWTKPLPAPDARLVLRLWPSRFDVDDAPLLLGALEEEALEHPFGLLSTMEDRDPGPAARADLTRLLRAGVGESPRILFPPGPGRPEDAPAP